MHRDVILWRIYGDVLQYEVGCLTGLQQHLPLTLHDMTDESFLPGIGIQAIRHWEVLPELWCRADVQWSGNLIRRRSSLIIYGGTCSRPANAVVPQHLVL